MCKYIKKTIVILAICFFCGCTMAKTAEYISPVVYLCETSSNRVLYSKNSNQKVKIASVTKFMTAILAIENCDLNEEVSITKEAAYIGGSTVGLQLGTKVSMKNLLYGLLLESGNDCAVAIAIHVSGNETSFVELMNVKANELKAYDTVFSNPHGLDTDLNCATAQDLYKIIKYAIQKEEILKIIQTKSITLKFGKSSKYLVNTNRLLHTYEYCIGGKTGFTNIANRCIGVIGQKENMTLIAIVLGSPTTDIRFNEAKKLLEYGFENFTMTDISNMYNWYVKIPVFKGRIQCYEKHIIDDIVIPLRANEIEEIYVRQTLLPKIKAPATKGMGLGDIAMYIGEEKIYQTSLYLEYDIVKNTIVDYMKYGIRSLFSISLGL